MAYLARQDDDEQNAPTAPRTASSAGPGASWAPGSMPAPLTPVPGGSSFPDISAYLRANADQGAGMGGKLAEGFAPKADQAIQSVKSEGDYSGVTEMQGTLDAMGSASGRESLIDQRFGASSPGGRRLDATIIGQTGTGPLDALRSQYGDLLAGVRQDPEPPPVFEEPKPPEEPKFKPGPRPFYGYGAR